MWPPNILPQGDLVTFVQRPISGICLALAGLRVLDLSDSIAGEFCCRLLADFGAEVGSIVFDRSTAQGRAKLIELARQVDVMVVGVDVDRDALLEANPACVVALVSDFGNDGAYRHWRGSELIFQALSGMTHENGSPGREPLYGVGQRARYAAEVGVYLTVLAALHARKTTGRGQQVSLEVAMNTAATAMPTTVEYAYSQLQDMRGKRRNPFMVVKCNDGWVSIWVHVPVWSAFCKVAGVPEAEQDPRFAKPKDRLDNWSELTARVQKRVRDLSGDEFLDRLLNDRIAGAKAYTALQLWKDTPHLAQRDYWQSVTTDCGQRPVLGVPFRLSRTPGAQHRASPCLGADTRRILNEIAGLAATEVDALDAAGGLPTYPLRAHRQDRPHHLEPPGVGECTKHDHAIDLAGSDQNVQVIVRSGEGKNWSAGHDIGSSEELEHQREFPLEAGTRGIFERAQRLYVDMHLRWRNVAKPIQSKFIDARQAREMGLFNRVVPREKLMMVQVAMERYQHDQEQIMKE